MVDLVEQATFILGDRIMQMHWIKRVYGDRASTKRYRILVSPSGQFSSVPVGGIPIYPYQSEWKEVIRINKEIPHTYVGVQSGYLALMRVLKEG